MKNFIWQKNKFKYSISDVSYFYTRIPYRKLKLIDKAKFNGKQPQVVNLDQGLGKNL